MTISQDIDTNLPDNTTGEITPERLRDLLHALDNSKHAYLKRDGSVEMTGNLILNNTGETQARVFLQSAAGAPCYMEGLNTDGSGIWKFGRNAGAKDKIELIANGDFECVLPAGMNMTAKIGGVFKTVAFVEDLPVTPPPPAPVSWPMIQQLIAHEEFPTKAECLEALQQITDFTWDEDRSFYMKDNSGSNVNAYLVKYVAHGASDLASATTDAVFWMFLAMEAM